MFRPDSNRDRTDYSSILMPPDGYRLVQRIINNCYIKPMPLPLH